LGEVISLLIGVKKRRIKKSRGNYKKNSFLFYPYLTPKKMATGGRVR